MADIHQEEKVLGILLCIAVISIGAALLLLARLWKREMQVADLKSEFVANVSHELRTPLTAIQYISDRLILGRVRSEDERKTLYKLLSDETKRLREMIEDVLDLSSLLKGKKIYHRDRADLIELTKEALLRHKQKLDAKPFHVETHWPQEPINVFVDARSVLQAISNLIDNAIKYSGDASRLNVEVRREGRGGQVSIQDFGIGIAPENHEKIFESFYRVETALTKNSEGVGLGLAMVRHIVQGNKGRMTLVSDLNRGSHFTLWFPQEN